MQNNQQGRSMLEMIGILGVIAIITLLGIKAFQLATRNSKFNKLKNDVYSIHSTIDNIYSRESFTASGKVLGVDKTYDSLFVLSGYKKENKTPFGGIYAIESIDAQNYLVKLEGLNSEDCAYAVSDNTLGKYENMKFQCFDTSGLRYEYNKSTIFLNEGLSMNEIAANYGHATGNDWTKVCCESRDENSEACQTLKQNPKAQDGPYAGILCGQRKYEWACDAIKEYNSNPETRGNAVDAARACAYGNEEMCNLVIKDLENNIPGSNTALAYACDYGSEYICKYSENHPDEFYSGYAGQACIVKQYKWACDAITKNFEEGRGDYHSMYTTCLYGSKDANNTYCNKLVNWAVDSESSVKLIKDSKDALSYACHGSQNYSYENQGACTPYEENPSLLDGAQYTGYLCHKNNYSLACQSRCSYDNEASACQKVCGADTCPTTP